MLRLRTLAIALVLVSCTTTPAATDWSAIAARADEAGLWSASETALLVVPGNLDPSATPEGTARRAADAAFDPFSPNECVTATVSGATVTYTLDDCAGSFGLVHATGQLVVTYMMASLPEHTDFHASATDLLLNGEAVTFDAQASVLHVSGSGERTIDVTVDTHGVGQHGTMFTRHGTQTARWSDTWGCLFIDTANDALTVDGVSWQAQTSALTLCVGECPEAGGAITWTGAPGSVQLGYGGVQAVDWSVPTDPTKTGMLTISCSI